MHISGGFLSRTTRRKQMKSKIVIAVASAFLASSLVAIPAASFAGDIKAKCEAKAKKNKVAEKDMKAYMKKCTAKKEKKAAK